MQDGSESVMSEARYATVMVIYDVPPPPMVPAKLAGELFRGLATNVDKIITGRQAFLSSDTRSDESLLLHRTRGYSSMLIYVEITPFPPERGGGTLANRYYAGGRFEGYFSWTQTSAG